MRQESLMSKVKTGKVVTKMEQEKIIKNKMINM